MSIANPDNEDEVEDEHRDSNSIRTRRCCERRPPYPHQHSPQILTSVLIIKTRAGGVEGGGLPVQVGRTNTVSSLGLAKDVGELPVQVGRTNTVSSLG